MAARSDAEHCASEKAVEEAEVRDKPDYVKGHFTSVPPWRSAFQTVLIGGLAAGAAFLIARAIS
jgi:hypothetical protein